MVFGALLSGQDGVQIESAWDRAYEGYLAVSASTQKAEHENCFISVVKIRQLQVTPQWQLGKEAHFTRKAGALHTVPHDPWCSTNGATLRRKLATPHDTRRGVVNRLGTQNTCLRRICMMTSRKFHTKESPSG